MSEESDFDPIRQVRQRLESLRRAGLDRINIPNLPEAPVAPRPRVSPKAETATPVHPARPEARAASTPPPPAPPPVVQPTSLFGEETLEGDIVPPDQRAGLLEVLRQEVACCQRCPDLARTRTQTVFGDGDPNAKLMFIGEAPGADEDRTGIPFVGRAGQLLNDMITRGMGLKREEVYIANILKSRPPGNRDPLPEEVNHCLPYLERQIEIIRPSFICMLGRIAAQTLLETSLPMGRLRGKWQRYKGIPTIVTYHPAYLLRNPAGKKDSWEDLKMLMRAMGLPVPEGRRSAE